MSALKLETAAIGLGAIALAGLAYWIVKKGPGLLSGNNAWTEHATNAAGEPVTAYQGAGVVGTVGAVANEASGGVLASVGQWIGGKIADVKDAVTGVNEQIRSTPATQYNAGNAGANGAGIVDPWSDYATQGDPFTGLGWPTP